MIISFDQKKIDLAIATAATAYVVTAYNIEMPAIKPDVPTADVHSSVVKTSADAEKARERLLAIRERIIRSGRPPLSPEELERTIGEARGR